MKVLQVLHDRERGGILTLANMLEDGLRPHGVIVETAYLFERPGLGTLAKLASAAAMARRLLRGGYDALIAYQATASILVGMLGGLRGGRFRVVHQTCMPGETALFVRLADRLVGQAGLYTLNVANSVATYEAFAAYPRAYRRGMVLIEHGLDPLVPMNDRADTRRRFGLPANDPCLLNVGRLVGQKNQALLVGALARLPSVHLAVAGDGPEAEPLRAQAAALGVDGRLHLLGALPSTDVADLYRASDLFVFPSRWETSDWPRSRPRWPACRWWSDLDVLHEVLRTATRAPVTLVSISDHDGWVAAIRTRLDEPSSRGERQAFAAEIGRRYSRQRMIDAYVHLFSAGGDLRAAAAEARQA